MENIKKFQDLLKELFQFETSDLDFGIYRILNYKRNQLKKFIENDLVDKVEKAFAKHKDERLENINQRFEDVRQKIIQAFGKEAFTPVGVVRKYLFILGEKEEKDVAIVWRAYEDTWSEDDFKKDKEFIIKELEPWKPHIVYVNGQSVLTPKLGAHSVEIRYIEPEFKRLMEI